MSAAPAVALAIEGAVGTITIARPARRNALDLPAVVALDEAVAAAVEAGCRSLVVTGSEGHFCAGADLTELEDLTFTHRLREALDRLAAAPLVTIAAISGSCMGLGMQLAIACDVRVATTDARFAVPVAKLGLMVDHWTLQHLAATLGEGAARHLVLTAHVMPAEDAFRLGFCQQLGGLAEANELATRVAELAPLSIRGSKLGFDLLHRSPDEPAYREAFECAWRSADLAEGRAAFAERRAPRFEGR